MENINLQAFLALVRAGLWEDVNLDLNLDLNLLETFGTSDQGRANGKVDWEKVYQLATEQSVLGLVLAGIERYKNLNLDLNLDDNIDEKGGDSQLGLRSTLRLELPSQMLLLQWIGEVQILEQQNREMNRFIEELIQGLRNADIYTLLVKGQGIAQCYERPLWRASGDVDLYLSETNYKRAQVFLTPKAQSVDEELHGEQHIAMHINQWVVELHGGMPTRLISRIDKGLEKIQNNLFCGGEVRSWHNGGTVVFLPSPDNDVLLVFTHILKHFYRGGIGLRQICDWCRLLWKYKDSLNYGLLEKRIREMGLMSEWKAFWALAVEFLGMPVEAMPMFNDNLNHDLNINDKLRRKAELILEFVMETGNFGYNRDSSYYEKRPYFIRKAISLRQHTLDGIHHFKVFPLDSLRIWCRMLRSGIKAAFERR